MKKFLLLLPVIAIAILNSCRDCTNLVCDYGFCTNSECTLWQDDFVGVYSGTYTCDGSSESHNVIITAGSSNNALIIDSVINATIVSSTSFEISSQMTPFQGDTATVTGSGTVSTEGLVMHVTIDQGGTIVTCVFN